ncbi:MAG: YHYH protein [Pseudomonadota bacterium]|nr:YHYH protein [Pseudomonadota bacterium]
MLFALLSACTPTDTADTAGDSLRTLATCETNIADDVPAFFQELYRCVDVVLASDTIVVSTIDLPPHPSPYYAETDPNWVAFDDQGGTHFHNPNELSEQAATVTIPSTPTAKGITITAEMVDLEAGTSDEEYPGGDGVGLDGTVLFAAMAAPGDDIAEEAQTFDTWEAHPQNTGIYHHHGPTPAALAVLVDSGWATTSVPGAAEIEVYGIMCDGTVLLGCTELNGAAPDATDFDAQGGHVHDLVASDGTTWFAGRYHTHMCVGTYDHIYTPEIQYYEGCERARP